MIESLLAMGIFEWTGLISGLLCVVLLIRKNIWTWPIGLVYSVVSLVVFYQAQLYSEFGLHIYYVGMNAYGWYFWSRPSTHANSERKKKSERSVTRIAPRTAVVLALLVLAGIPILAEIMQRTTDADLAYIDSAIAVLSFAAMWMSARKMLENWAVWLVVDVIATGVYLVKGIELYAVLYGVYIVMAVAGHLAWRAELVSAKEYQQAAP